jgi:methyl-accepting chemotaxis protein
MVSQISVASREQSQGVGEITKAMNQLEQVTTQNSSIAQKSATNSVQLKREAEGLSGMVGELLSAVNGSGSPSVKAAPSTPKTEVAITAKKEAKTSQTVDEKPKKAKAESKASSTKVDLKAKTEKKEPKVSIDTDLGVPQSDDPRFEDL